MQVLIVLTFIAMIWIQFKVFMFLFGIAANVLGYTKKNKSISESQRIKNNW